MTTTPTSGAADLRATFSEMLVDLPNTEPFTLFKAGFDAALAAGQATAAPAQPAAQQGAAYAALPEPYCNAHDDADACYPDMFSEHQMRAFADATHALRASNGQAPAQPDQPIACSYGDNGYACCEGGPCQADVHNDKLAEQQAPQPVAREPLTPERVKEIVRGAGYDQCGIPDTERAAFINGLRHGEQAHGIKGGQHVS